MKTFYLVKEITPSVIRKNMENHEYGLCEGIITADGQFYASTMSHADALYSMYEEDIDLKGALRLANTYMQGTFLTSLQNYKFIDPSFASEVSIYLTDEQAKTIFKIYEVLKKTAYPSLSMKNILKASENLGWDFRENVKPNLKHYSNTHAKHNLALLQNTISEKYDLAKVNRRDLNFFDLIDEVLDDNRQKRIQARQLEEDDKIKEDDLKEFYQLLDKLSRGNNPLNSEDNEKE